MPTLRVVLDTNVLLSGIAYPGSVPGKIVAAWRHGSLDVILSRYILDELRRVMPRLAHRHGLTEREVEDLVDILSIQAEIVEPADVPDAAELRDAADLPVLGTCLAVGQSLAIDYLVSGDKDLLALSERYPIVSPAQFWATHGGL
jgi:putative PIN family toxin of toxin-antitoxin system